MRSLLSRLGAMFGSDFQEFLSIKRGIDAWVLRHLREMRLVVAILGVLLVASAAFIVYGGPPGTNRLAQLPPTPPSPSAYTPTVTAPSISRSPVAHPSKAKTTKTATCTSHTARGAGGAVPVHICIPQIGVNADVMQVGLNADRTVQVPPLNEVGLAAWYKYSPAPGVIGPSIILGHIDSAQYGKGIFFDLGKLQHGAKVSLMRADGMMATYQIDKVEEYPKSNFPTQTVYGNTSDAAIRLITCGGNFDASAGNYLDNIVAFGTLLSLTQT